MLLALAFIALGSPVVLGYLAWRLGKPPGLRTVTASFPPYQLQEDGHPNYWGQLALRNCFRQAVTTGGAEARGGYCSRGTGLNAKGEPNMTLN